MHEAEVAEAPLGEALVVEQHLGHGAVRGAVAVVIEFIHARVSVVVVAAHDRAHVRVGRDDFVVDPLRDRAEATGREHVLVKLDEGDALGILLEHLVHPLDLFIARAPSHVQDDVVLAPGADEVVVAAVVLVATAVPRVAAVTALAEVFAVLRIVVGVVANVVVACENAIGELRVVERFVGLICADPALGIVDLVDDVARVEHVLKVHLFAHAQKVVVDRDLVVVDLRIVVVVLGVRLNGEGVVVVRTRGVVGVLAGLRSCAIGEVCTGVSNTLLNESLDLAIHVVTLERDDRFELRLARFAIRKERLDFFPAVLLGVPHEKTHALSLVGSTGPAHADLRVFACALGHGGRELVEGKCRTRGCRLTGLERIALAVCLVGVVDASRSARERTFAKRGRVALTEGDREVILAGVGRGRRKRIVYAHVQARAIRRIKGGRRLLDGRRERDRLLRLVTELVRRDDRQRVRACREGKRGERRAGFDLLAVEGCGRARDADAGVGCLEVQGELAALLGAVGDRGGDHRGGVVDDDGRLHFGGVAD